MALLSEKQLRQYREEGFTVVSGLFTAEELNDLEEAFDGIVARRTAKKADADATWRGEEFKKRYGGDMRLFVTHDVQAYSAAWSKVLVHERLTAAFSELMDSPNVQLHHTKLFQKPPEKGSAFPMHQDYPYFPHERHTMMAGIIHISEATEDMGCVCVYPGSHKNGPMPCYEHNHLNPDEWPIEGAVKCPAQRGDVVFFNYLTVHGSGINASDKTRKTVLLQVRDPADRPTEDAHRSHAQGLIMRGVHPLRDSGTASGTLESGEPEVAPAQ